MEGRRIPRDAVFKHLLSHRATARDFSWTFTFPHRCALCNLNTLRLESGSFIDATNCGRVIPISFTRCKRRRREGYIYLLIEHQSSDGPPYGISPDALCDSRDAASSG